MLKKRHIVEIVSVAVIAFLLGTMLNYNLLTMAGKEDDNDDGSPWDRVWTAISELESKVDKKRG